MERWHCSCQIASWRCVPFVSEIPMIGSRHCGCPYVSYSYETFCQLSAKRCDPFFPPDSKFRYLLFHNCTCCHPHLRNVNHMKIHTWYVFIISNLANSWSWFSCKLKQVIPLPFTFSLYRDLVIELSSGGDLFDKNWITNSMNSLTMSKIGYCMLIYEMGY